MEVIETKEYVGDPAFCTVTTQLFGGAANIYSSVEWESYGGVVKFRMERDM